MGNLGGAANLAPLLRLNFIYRRLFRRYFGKTCINLLLSNLPFKIWRGYFETLKAQI
jgi:hypothetical protein